MVMLVEQLVTHAHTGARVTVRVALIPSVTLITLTLITLTPTRTPTPNPNPNLNPNPNPNLNPHPQPYPRPDQVTQAETLDFGDLQPYLPHALVTSTYADNLRLQARGCVGVRVTLRARSCAGVRVTLSARGCVGWRAVLE